MKNFLEIHLLNISLLFRKFSFTIPSRASTYVRILMYTNFLPFITKIESTPTGNYPKFTHSQWFHATATTHQIRRREYSWRKLM